MQGYFPTYSPRTPRLAEIYGKFDPAGSFLSGAEKVARIDLARAAEDRLKSAADMDIYIKNSLLPHQLDEAQAKILQFNADAKYRQSLTEYNAARTKAAADGLTEQQVIQNTLGALRSNSNVDPWGTAVKSSIPATSNSAEDTIDAPPSDGNPISEIYGEETAEDAFFDDIESDVSGVDLQQVPAEVESVSGTPPEVQTGNVVDIPEENMPKPELDVVPVTGAEDAANLPASEGKYRLAGQAGVRPQFSDAAEDDPNNPINRFIDESIAEEFGTPEVPKARTFDYSAAWTDYQTKNGATASLISQARITKDPIAKARALFASERLMVERDNLNQFLQQTGLNFEVADLLTQKFGGDSGVLNRAIEIRKTGAPKYGVPAGANIDVISQVIARENTEYFNKPEPNNPSAIAKSVTEINQAIKGLEDQDGNISDENLPAAEKLYSQRDAILGTPTGTSLFADRFRRIQDKSSKLAMAAENGVAYGGIVPEQAPAELARLNEQVVALAVEKSPYFGNDREKMGRWLSNPETKGLPFIAEVSGVKTPLFPTDEQNVYRMWNPKGKVWQLYDRREEKPQETTDPAQAKKTQTTSKNANEAGIEFAQVARDALGLNEEGRYMNPWAEDTGESDWLINAADYANTGVRNRVLAPAAEFAAGLSGRKLSLGRTPNPSISNRIAAGRLTPDERSAILARTQNPLVSFALESTLGK